MESLSRFDSALMTIVRQPSSLKATPERVVSGNNVTLSIAAADRSLFEDSQANRSLCTYYHGEASIVTTPAVVSSESILRCKAPGIEIASFSSVRDVQSIS